MERVCIFCGRRPESKTVEHVLPQWLIELTGPLKRTAEFGYRHLENGKLVKRRFSFKTFQFPACKSCNQNFASLEADAKLVTQKILSEDFLSESELNTILDWFDKIRIGLWLGYRYLDKNRLIITPHYHIEHRIGQHDRMLVIFKTDGNKRGLNFAGYDTPSFGLTPSCFSIRINNYCFLNISYPNLLCRRIGFPYPFETFMLEDERLSCRFVKGRNRIMLPLLKKLFRVQGTELYQPMFVWNISNTAGRELWDTKYVYDNCISWEQGVGKIFIKGDSKLNVYPAYPSKEWTPKITYHFEDLLFEIQVLTLEWQLYIDSLQPSIKFLSKEKRSVVEQKRHLSKYYNKEIIQILRKRAENMEIPPIWIQKE